jgi:murein DD-endopeptidase MepM/ murein hydrolase activator NlpD
MAFPRRPAKSALFILALASATLLAPCSLAKAPARGLEPTTAMEAGQPDLVHRVSKGQTLSEIALRYHVTVRALEQANGLRSGGVIRPGQRLQIPGPPQAKAETKATVETKATEKSPPKAPRATSVKPSAVKAKATPGVSGKAEPVSGTLAASTKPLPSKLSSNKLGPNKLGKAAAVLSVTAPARAASGSDSWKNYRKPAPRPGYVVLHGTAGAYSGFAILKGDRLSPKAYLEIRRVLASWRTGKQVDISERLIRLMVKTSDTFGGRPLRIVGGYREHSYFQDSKHPLGHAVDFSVDGIPNTVLRDFLRTQARVGVGFYPNSSFVHLDVRNRSAYWVDHAGPGQRPKPSYRPAPATPPPVDAAPSLNAEKAPDAPAEPSRIADLSI